jgi:hypothetical protein
MLERARWSVEMQTLAPARHLIEWDDYADGAAVTRQRGLDRVDTEWTAFLDSDDYFYPEHLEYLAAGALALGADYVYSYFTVHDAYDATVGDDPLMLFGVPFNPENPTQTTMTILVRTELAQKVGFREPDPGMLIPGTTHRHGEDYEFTLGCVREGAKILHGARRTWAWCHHGLNTGGLAGHGDAED